ncbi:MAG: N-acetyltransferase [Bacteroidales bacterium]|nr:N-acetyltransferase [Bacteroidales bacterium]
MPVRIQEVKSEKEKKAFVELPFSVYKGNAYWVPPIKADELKSMSPETNPAMRFSETKFWLAYRDDKVVGRIMAIVNHRYIEKTGEKYGRFSKLEFFDDAEAFVLLMDTAISWLRGMGMEKVHGPLGYTNLDNQGLLIEGFDYLPSVASVYHLPYYQQHINDYGFEKEADWVEFRLTMGKDAIEKSNRGVTLIKKRYGFEVMRFNKTSELLPHTDAIFEVLNDAFAVLPFVVPFDKEMMEMYKEKYLKVINPRYVCMVKDKDQIVGFMIAVPSLSEAMQKANGRLFPFGFIHIMKSMRKPKVLDFFLAGVKPGYETQGAAVMMYNEIQNQMLEDGATYVETTGEFETNHKVIANWKNFDHIQHKRRRCYIKTID